MTTTYQGWTEEQIQQAENDGTYIPVSVMTDYMNGDTDENRKLEDEEELNFDEQ